MHVVCLKQVENVVVHLADIPDAKKKPIRNAACFGCVVRVQEPKIKLKKKDVTGVCRVDDVAFYDVFFYVEVSFGISFGLFVCCCYRMWLWRFLLAITWHQLLGAETSRH